MTTRGARRLRSYLWPAVVVTATILTGSAVAVASPDAVACVVEDATLSWGFKESFRSYLSGSIANGEWAVSDGAQYETPEFRFDGGSGHYDPARGEGAIDFDGTITFTGHGGILNTTIANPTIELLDADTGYLLLDVAGTTMEGEAVEASAVRFVSLDLEAATEERRSGESWAMGGIPTALTDAGAAAFGTYRAGETLDPLTFSLAFDGECVASVDPRWIAWAGIGLLAAALLIASTLLIAVRGRPGT